MSNVIIGNCSLCGGSVVYPTVWYSTQPPEPYCSRCGATMARPVIEMTRPLITEDSQKKFLQEYINDYVQKGKEKVGNKL